MTRNLVPLAEETRATVSTAAMRMRHITVTGDGRVLTKTAQVRMCGNSVSPPMAEAYVRANYSERQPQRQVA